MKSGGIKNKKGYSLLETVIALSLIAIAFGTAMTAIFMSINIRKQVMNTKYFITETSDFLECYKIGGSDDFALNALKYLDCGADTLTVYEQQTENGSSGKTVYAVYYSGGYKMLADDEQDNAYFVLYITVGNSFDAVVKQANDGKTVYRLKEPYYSRFDLNKA